MPVARAGWRNNTPNFSFVSSKNYILTKLILNNFDLFVHTAQWLFYLKKLIATIIDKGWQIWLGNPLTNIQEIKIISDIMF